VGVTFAAHALHVARDELKTRVPIRGAALIREGHPSGERGLVVALAQDHHVIRLPVEAVRQVRHLDSLLAAARLESPQQRGFRDQVVRNLGKAEAAGIVERDLVADPQDRASVHREHLGLNRLVDARLRVGAVHAHGSAHVLLEELLRAQQIELVILLEHLEALPTERTDVHRLRLDARGDVPVLERDAPAPQVERPHLAHETEVLVVDRHRDRVPLLGGGAQRRAVLLERLGGRGRRRSRAGRHRHGGERRDHRENPAHGVPLYAVPAPSRAEDVMPVGCVSDFAY
jgi:hypothetical protein